MMFELTDDQIQRLVIWQTEMETKHKKYGKYRFEFTNVGIGTVVKVKSDLAKKRLDLTEYEKW